MNKIKRIFNVLKWWDMNGKRSEIQNNAAKADQNKHDISTAVVQKKRSSFAPSDSDW